MKKGEHRKSLSGVWCAERTRHLQVPFPAESPHSPLRSEISVFLPVHITQDLHNPERPLRPIRRTLRSVTHENHSSVSLRKDLGGVLAETEHGGEEVIITRSGKPVAVLIGMER
jgi:prevent-host-death family protein